jgi:NAD+ kinase
VRLARLSPRPFAERLVNKFGLPVAGWRGPTSEETTAGGRSAEKSGRS